jgi:hypothetical protein
LFVGPYAPRGRRRSCAASPRPDYRISERAWRPDTTGW